MRGNCTRSRMRIHTVGATLGGDYTQYRMRIGAKKNPRWKLLKQSGLYMEGITGEEGHNWKRPHTEGATHEGKDLVVLLEIW